MGEVFPPGTRKLNDSLYELYVGSGEPNVDIIFFHGLQLFDATTAWWKTWSGKMKMIWPRDFLGEDFPKARILSVSYNSVAWKLWPLKRFDIDQEGKKLVSNLLKNEKGIGDRPVILVGHSLGGLVIKSFILQAHHQRCLDKESSRYTLDRFLDRNLVGVFYFATPNGGSALTDVKDNLTGSWRGPKTFLKTFEVKAASLNHEFSLWRRHHDHSVPVVTIVETRPIACAHVFGKIIVGRSSAFLDSDSVYIVDADHSVCKPEWRTDPTYLLLRQFIAKNAGLIGERDLAGWRSCPDELPDPLEQINESLYELHRPSDGAPAFDIIFFHGLLKNTPDTLLETWSKKGEPMWPRTILPEIFPQARVLAVRYDSQALKAAKKGSLDIYFVVEALVKNMLFDDKADIGTRPVILVGQGLGSLVLKEFVMRADFTRSPSRLSLDHFLDENICGIFDLAKPSIVADLVKDATLAAVTCLKLSSRDVSRLSSNFDPWVQCRKISMVSVVESSLFSKGKCGFAHNRKETGTASERLEVFINECLLE